MVFQIRKGVAVGVPCLVVSEVHLYEAYPGLDQLRGHQQAPAEGVFPISFLELVIDIEYVECLLRFLVREE